MTLFDCIYGPQHGRLLPISEPIRCIACWSKEAWTVSAVFSIETVTLPNFLEGYRELQPRPDRLGVVRHLVLETSLCG